MKKILSVAMAAAMVASMATVAFAAEELDAEKRVNGYEDQAYTYSSSAYRMTAVTANVAYGKTIYIPLTKEEENGTDKAKNWVLDQDATKSISIRSNWTYGREIVEDVKIVAKKVKVHDTGSVDSAGDPNGRTPVENKYYYFLAIDLKDMPSTTSESDLIGKITLRKSSKNSIVAGAQKEETEFDVEINQNVEYNTEASDYVVTDAIQTFDFDDGDVEEWIEFSEHDNDYFVVDTCDQSDLNLKVTATFNSEVAGKFPEANLHFFNGNYATFNRIGELTLAGCDIGAAKAVYAIDKDGVISAVKAEYDSYEEAFKVKTRTLGVYFLSDVELDLTGANTTVTPPETEDDTTTTTPNNPNTGAIA